MSRGPATPLLEAQGIRVRFGRRAVLRRVDLELGAGEIVGLVGANGAGKTTLFAVLTGLLPADGGERRLAGRPLEGLGITERAQIAYVAHRPQLYPGLTARENLELYAGLRAAAGVTTLGSDGVLARFGLAEAAALRTDAFSRGMLQRLALARALAGRPAILILDEPFTALDHQGRDLLAGILAEERARGAAILLSSHDQAMLVRVADRILHLEGGVIAGEVRYDPEDHGRRVFREAAAALWAGTSPAAVGSA